MLKNVRLLRRISTNGFDSGMRYLPMLSIRFGLGTRVDDSSGVYEFRFRLRKSNMLCRAGLTPVANVDQATGDNGGNVVRSRLKPPISVSLARLGSLPAAMNCSARVGSRPSRPRKISFLIFAFL